ncbi:MBL fold metallo-hydrolase [Sandarakinorhabdus rubra]|uniref:MBL fold metallo-hydrolase n=1 Tax=Sandarakinorhabdus rubra TaxID=2672568 RepID=UPI0013DBCEF4|nr:MBL fold metallo-hydrolase [Sandarakinorhabdus rubra]
MLALLLAGALACPATGLSVAVLGSGGPIAEGRAGPAYVVLVNGRPRLLVDAGPGALLRLGEAGIPPETLDAIAISHLHVDHAGDLPAILKSANFADPPARLALFGPDGRGLFPGLAQHMASLLEARSGAFRYLSDWLAGPQPRLVITEVASGDSDSGHETLLIDRPDYRLSALAVHHGVVPALAFVVRSGGQTAVLAGDQSEFSDGFDKALAGSRPGLLVMHHAIPEGPGQPRGLHRPPSAIGQAAAGLGAGRLVLSHNMKRALDRQAEGLAAIRQAYAGAVSIAHDGGCYPASKPE